MVKRLLFSTGVFFIFFSCKTELSSKQKDKVNAAVKVDILNFEKLEPLLNLKDDKIYIINFWATWCKPCVEELPAFEKLNETHKNKKVEVILVSLDFPKQVEERVKPFIKKKNLKSRVILLDDVNEDSWIKKVSEKWSGAIPATLIYTKNKRMFYKQSFDYELLKKEVETFID